MKPLQRFVLAGLVVGVLLSNTAVRADIIPWDDVLRAIGKAGTSLAAGEDRQTIVTALKKAIQANPNSRRYQERARSLVRDIEASIRKAKSLSPKPEAIQKNPELYLMETTVPIHLIMFKGNWVSLTNYSDRNRDDPVSLILKRGRPAIEQLIPLLNDRTATRSYQQPFISGVMPTVARVCDIAMLLVERLSLCRFHEHATGGHILHDASDLVLEKKIKYLKPWWGKYGDKPISAGIRAEIERGEYATISMVRNLIEVGRKNSPEDVDYGLNVLRKLVRQQRSTRAARLLAENGDTDAVEFFYQQWKATLGKPGIIYDSGVAFFLMRYGQRREWELLHTIGKREIDQGLSAGTARVWPALINGSGESSPPWVVPSLALALSQTRISGSRSIANFVGSQAFSYADKAAELLQKHTSQDFGYRPEGSPEQRSAAIRKAQKWWHDTGSQQYTFDRIEQRLRKANERPGNRE